MLLISKIKVFGFTYGFEHGEHGNLCRAGGNEHRGTFLYGASGGKNVVNE